MTAAVVTAVEPELGAHERRLARARPNESLTAWELCRRGRARFEDVSPDSLREGRRLFEASAEADPHVAPPRALPARVSKVLIANAESDDPAAEPRAGLGRARAAPAIDDRLETAHAALGVPEAMAGRHDAAAASVATAVRLNADSAFRRHAVAPAEPFHPTPDPAAMVAAGEAAPAPSPKDPSAHACWFMVAVGHLIRTRDVADPDDREAVLTAVRQPGAAWIAEMNAAMAELAAGRPEAARAHVAAARAGRPWLTLARYPTVFRRPVVRELLALGEAAGLDEGLVEAGLPRD